MNQPKKEVDLPLGILSISWWRRQALHRFVYLGLAAIFALSIVAYFGSSRMPGSGNSSPSTMKSKVTILTVNGIEVPHSDFDKQWRQMQSFAGGAGPTTEASYKGMIAGQLLNEALVRSIAKKQGLKVADAEVDKQIETMKKGSGQDQKPITDEQLEQELDKQGMTIEEFRSELKERLLGSALMDSFANKVKVSETDLLKTYDEFKARQIFFPTSGMGAMPDAAAKAAADAAFEAAKTTPDFAKLANELTKDPNNTRPKYDPKTKKSTPEKLGGALPFVGPDGWYKVSNSQDEVFDQELSKIKKGEIGPPFKASKGYFVVKVEDYRRQLPADYAKNKADLLQNLKRSKASKPYQELVEKEKAVAKITWADLSLKWMMDYSKTSGMGMMNPNAKDRVSEDQLIAEIQASIAKDPDDALGSLILAQTLNKQLMMASIPQASKKPLSDAEAMKVRVDIVNHYEQALKHLEDRQTRFDLADAYERIGKKDKSLEQLQRIMRLLAYNEDTTNRHVYTQLESRFRSAGRVDLADQAKAKFTSLEALFQKEEAERKAKEAEEKKAADAKAAAEKAKDPAATGSKTTATSGETKPQVAGVPPKTSTVPSESKAPSTSTKPPVRR